MKRFTLPLLALFTVILLTQSCKNEPNIKPEEIIKPNPESFQTLRAAALTSLAQSDTLSADSALTFTSTNGVTLSLDAGALIDEEGNAVTGDVALTYIELFDQGNMVASNKPLLGLDKDENLNALATGGEFYITFTQNEKNLKLAKSYTLAVPAALTGEQDKDMTLWDGITQTNGDIFWTAIVDREAGINHQENDSLYQVYNDQFGWTNIDKVIAKQEDSTALTVAVPADYNYANSAVYFTYKGQGNALVQLTEFTAESSSFTEKSGNVAIGDEINVIFVSESKNSFAVAVKTVTVEAATSVKFEVEDLKTTNANGLVSLINGLD